MKRTTLQLACGIAAVASLALAGCASQGQGSPSQSQGSPSSPGGSQVIYLIQPPQTNPFFIAEADAAQAAADELGYKLVVVSHDEDPQKESQLFDTAIADGAVAIIVDPAQADPAVVDAQKAKDAKIPTVAIDRELAKTGVAAAQFLSNSTQCANISAQAFAQALGGAGTYIELVGQAGVAEATTRSGGFHQILDQVPGLKMVGQETADWDQQKGFEKTVALLSAHPDITGVIAGNDTMALGAVAALKAASRTDVAVAGFDGSPDMVAAITAGDATATALQPIVQEADTAVRAIDAFVKGGGWPSAEKQLLDCKLITADNVQNYADWALSK